MIMEDRFDWEFDTDNARESVSDPWLAAEGWHRG